MVAWKEMSLATTEWSKLTSEQYFEAWQERIEDVLNRSNMFDPTYKGDKNRSIMVLSLDKEMRREVYDVSDGLGN